MKKQILLSVLAVNLVACGANVERADVNPTPHDTYQGEGLFSGKSGNLLQALNEGKGSEGGSVVTALPVNVYLWHASLDAISFMPLASANSTDGVVITDWYTNPNKPTERVKVNVYIKGKTFSAQNLKVSVFKQAKRGGEWVDVAADTTTATQLEETILTNARALKIKAQAIQ
ncbi:MAG: hypothetical protein CMF61_03755 [Magnetococcales bacterium]|nr:hypothetical protein [Magnetococcales bacterium]